MKKGNLILQFCSRISKVDRRVSQRHHRNFINKLKGKKNQFLFEKYQVSFLAAPITNFLRSWIHFGSGNLLEILLDIILFACFCFTSNVNTTSIIGTSMGTSTYIVHKLKSL